MNATSPHPTAALVRQLLEEPLAERRTALCSKHGAGLELVEALKAEVDRHKNSDSAQALLAGERALEASEFITDSAAKPLGLWAMALGLTAQGAYSEALMYFDKARIHYDQLDRVVDAARVSVRQLQALAITGDYLKALEVAEAARDIFATANLTHEAAQVENNIGLIHSRLGRAAESEKAIKRAMVGFSKVGDKLGMAQAHLNLGSSYQEQDFFGRALEHSQAALSIFRELELTQSVALTLVNLATLHRREGRASQALRLLSQAREVYNQLESSPDAALAQLEEARVSLDLQLLDEAETLASELIETFAARQMQLEQVEALVVLGTVRVRARRTEEALDALSTARTTLLELGNPTQAALVNLYIANLHLSTLADPQGDAAMTYLDVTALAQNAIATLQEVKVRSGVAFGLTTLAEAQLGLGHTAEAKNNLQSAEALAQDLGVPDLIIRAKRLLGQRTFQEGEFAEAERLFDGAIEALEGVRASLQIDEFKAAYVGDKLSVYGDMVALLLEQGRTREALAYTERAKSRALLDLLSKGVETRAPTSDPTLERLSQRLKEVRAELNWHYLAAEEEGKSGAHWHKVTEGEREVTSLIRELERLKPEAAALERVAKPDLDKVFASLDENTVLIEYFGTEASLSAFVLSRGEVRAVTDIASPDDVRHHLERLGFFFKRVAQSRSGALPTHLPPNVYANLYGPEMLTQNVNTHLKALFDLLIAPLGLELSEQTAEQTPGQTSEQTLVMIPHGPIHAVPFAALFDGERYLLEQVALASAPSASVYALCKGQAQRPPGQMMAFGVPAEDIPAVEQEVEDVTKLFSDATAFIGVDATLDTFYKRAPHADVLHIATHGVHRPDNPMFSGLRLFDGWLAARDLYAVQLSASLVVLPACESVLASNTEGDELFGIARGFLYAGAPSLIGSLWPVQDEQTAQLMVAFYSALRRGLDTASALREAQLAVREAHPNPYHWAAFYGHRRPRTNGGEPPPLGRLSEFVKMCDFTGRCLEPIR